MRYKNYNVRRGLGLKQNVTHLREFSMIKSIQLAALVLATALAVVACKPAETTTSTTESKTTTTGNAVPAVPATGASDAAKQ